MAIQSCNTGRIFGFVGKALFGILAVCLLTNAACPQVGETRPNYDVTPRRLDLIPPGTVIDKGPPKDWSHLIIKSHPRAGAGDFRRLSPSAAQLSSLLYTAIVANVRVEKAGNSARHRLAGLAVGLGTRVNGKDVVLSPEKQQALGANLSFLGRVVLSKAQDKLQEVQLIARSDTMALVDAPGLLQRDGRHRPVVLRYAVLVDAATGGLETLLWVIERDERGGYKGTTGPAEWLPPNKLEDCVLHVDANEFSLGVPSENAFAMNRIPQGQKQVPLPDDVKAIAGRSRLSDDLAYRLETRLRELMK
jgi:hypothetical protein